jgi:DNA-binding LacI/PurR family transcriptional regulator
MVFQSNGKLTTENKNIEPELTTVEQPVSLMAKRVLQLLFGAIETDVMGSKEEVLNPNILMRNSC